MIAQGAEAQIFHEGDYVIKKRIPKSYRLEKLDNTLRKTRKKREKKVLHKLHELGIKVPLVYEEKSDDYTICMDYIPGEPLKDVLESSDYKKICKKIGVIVAKFHDEGIIHLDLTTSNIIFSNDNLYLIDFGLSFFSHKAEDKAVDLHLIKRALESKHYRIFEEAFQSVLEGYNTSPNYKTVIKRLETVEKRGRNKQKS